MPDISILQQMQEEQMRLQLMQQEQQARIYAQQFPHGMIVCSSTAYIGARSQLGETIPNVEQYTDDKRLPVWNEYTDPVKKRAYKLLAKKIGFFKFRSLRKKGYFDEKGKAGIFRFYNNDSGGVALITKVAGRDVEIRLCIQTMQPDLPKGDVILSRWMELKNNEDEFMRVCNFVSASCKSETHRRENTAETK